MNEVELLQQAKQAIQAGDKAAGQRFLIQVIKQTPRSETAWLWLSAIVDDPAWEKECLERVLEINPDNEIAQRHLAKLAQESPASPLARSETKPIPSQAPTPPKPPTEQSQSALSANSTQSTNARGLDEPSRKQWMTLDLAALLPLDLQQVLGLLGCVVLFLGVFAPIVRLPIVGTLNYFQNGKGDGVIILLLAAISLVLIILRRREWLWLTGLGSLGMLVSALGNLVWAISRVQSQIETELAGNLFGGLVQALFESIQIEWGWAILILGTGLVLAAAVQRGSPLPWKIVGAGLALAVLLSVSVLLLPHQFSGSSDLPSGSSATELRPRARGGQKNPIAAGEEIAYSGGTLKLLRMHDPTGFLVTDCLSMDWKGARPVRGTRYVAVELAFTCSREQVVCEFVPEAGLKLLLEDGRTAEDNWCVHDATRLGGEDVVGGGTVEGWRVFRVPDDGTIQSLVVAPSSGPALYAGLPRAEDGYHTPHDWIEGEGIRSQIVPLLRQELEALGLDIGMVLHNEEDGGIRLLTVEVCEEVSVYFDEEKALDDHAQQVLDVVALATEYTTQGEHLGVLFGGCSSFSFSEVKIAFRSRYLGLWKSGSIRDGELLDQALVTLN